MLGYFNAKEKRVHFQTDNSEWESRLG
jgi:hypothetical protein